MKALRLHGSRCVRLDALPAPSPEPLQAVVEMRAITLNHLDLYGYRGMTFARRQLPIIVGGEGAGRVKAVGKDVTNVRPGDRVAVYPGIVCRACASCLSGRENLCEAPTGVMGFHLDGVAADQILAPAANLIPLPEALDWETAACAPVTFATVEHMLVDNARLSPGETILVQAGGSGIGAAAISLGKALGARVITTVGSDEKAARIAALKPDHIINYTRHRFDREVLKLTEKRGVDVVFEHVGPATWEGSLMSLRRGGRLVICGSTSGVSAPTNLMMLFNKQITIHASFGSSIANVQTALERLASGQTRPLIFQTTTLERWEKALHKLADRQVAGKVVIRMAGGEK